MAGLELSVAIRTLELGAGRLWLGAGGGIVADSDPQRELEEALVKARPIAAAIGTTAVIERAASHPPSAVRVLPVPSALPELSSGPTPDRSQGVFETLLATDGRIQALGAHLGRLARSAFELYGATLPPGAVRRAARGGCTASPASGGCGSTPGPPAAG